MTATFDYSNLEHLAYRDSLRANRPVSDERFFWAISAIPTALLGHELKQNLLAEVDESQPRKRGRPKDKELLRLRLAEQVQTIERDAMDSLLRVALVERLRNGVRILELDGQLAINNDFRKHSRDMDIFSFYKIAYASLKAGPPYTHPLMSLVDPSSYAAKPLSTKALLIVSDIMRRVSRLGPPSIGRMRNIISGYYCEKRERN